MRNLSRTLLLAGLSLAATLPTLAQQAASQGIPGFLNPKDGSFHVRRAAPTADAVEAAVALTPYNGKLVFTFTINLITPVPSGHQVSCQVDAGLDDFTASYTNFIGEAASSVATVSGSKATCSVKIPYFWQLANGPGDTISLGYTVAIYPTSTTSLTNAITRSSSQQIQPIAVPLPGTTTTKTFTVNL